MTEHPTTKVARSATRIVQELAVIGGDAGDYTVKEWIQGSAEPDADAMTVLVFLETWCPHCRREVPQLEAKSKEWSQLGVGVVGFTCLTRSSTMENTKALLEENQVTYPVAVETGEIAERYNVSGIPAAAITSKGTIGEATQHGSRMS